MFDFFIIVLLIFWLIYSVAVVIYLNLLTTKYLSPVKRDEIVGDKKLKSYQEIIEQYADSKVINVLVLTGGGVRGMVPLCTLSYIEQQTGKKIGELFDFFSGSSTGAITAACLTVTDNKGNYKISATELFNRYQASTRKIFSSPWYHQLLTLFGLVAPRFLPDNKMEVLDSYFGDMTIGELKGNILIPVYNIDQNNLQIIKNWQPINGKTNDNYLVKDLINGASNPPMLFTPTAFSLKGLNHMFIDPAVLLNNPVLHVLLYMKMIFPNKHLNVVMIGNGGSTGNKYDYRNMFSFGLYGLYQYLFSAPALNSALSVEFMEKYLLEAKDAEKYDENTSLFRIGGTPDEYLSPVNVSQTNMDNILKFSNNVLEKNKVKVDDLIEQLIKDRFETK